METEDKNRLVERKSNRNYCFIMYYCHVMCFINTDNQRINYIVRLSVPRGNKTIAIVQIDKNPAE
jgi:hypothetical protein